MAEVSQPQEERLKNFDPNKPLVVNANEISGLETVNGRFVFKRPTIKDRLQIGVLTAKFKQSQELDALHENMAYILATLQVVCTEKPLGFVFEDCYEVESIFALFDKYSQWLEFFRKPVQADTPTAS
jgi:hypothetical protein